MFPWARFLFFLPEAPVDGNVIIQQHVRQAPFGAVLRDDTDIRDLNRTADKFAEIGVVQLPEDKMVIKWFNRHCQWGLILLVFPGFLFSSAGLSSPNFLHLLPDGFREGKVFVFDVFHRHHPPITATQTRPLSLLSSPQIYMCSKYKLWWISNIIIACIGLFFFLTSYLCDILPLIHKVWIAQHHKNMK